MERVKTIMKRIGALFLAAALTISMLPEIEMKNVKGENLVEAYENDKTSTSELSEELCPVTEDVTMTVSDTPGNEPEELSQTYVDDSMVSVNLALQYIERDAFGYDEIQKRVVTKEVDKDTTLANIIEGLTFGEGKTEYEITGWKTDCDLNLTADNLPYYVYLDAEYEKVPVVNYWELTPERFLVWASPSWKVTDLWENINFPDNPLLWTTDSDEDAFVESYKEYVWEKTTEKEDFQVLLEYRYYDEMGADACKYELVMASKGEKRGDILNRATKFTPVNADKYGFKSWSVGSENDEISEGEKLYVYANYSKIRVDVRCKLGDSLFLSDDSYYWIAVFVSRDDYIYDIIRQLEPAEAPEGTRFIRWKCESDWISEGDSVYDVFLNENISSHQILNVVAEFDSPSTKVNLFYLDDQGERAEKTVHVKLSPHLTGGDLKTLIPSPNSASAKYTFKGWKFEKNDDWYQQKNASYFDEWDLYAIYDVESLNIRQYYYAKDAYGNLERKCLNSYVNIPVGMDYSQVSGYLREVTDCGYPISGWKDLNNKYSSGDTFRKYVEFEAVYSSFAIHVLRYYMTKEYKTGLVEKDVNVTPDMTYNQVLQSVPLPDDALDTEETPDLIGCCYGNLKELIEEHENCGTERVFGRQCVYGKLGLICIENYPEEEACLLYMNFFDKISKEYKFLASLMYRVGSSSYIPNNIILESIGCVNWEEHLKSWGINVSSVGKGGVEVKEIIPWYYSVEVVYHYLDNTEKTIVISDDILKYGWGFYFNLEEGHSWTYNGDSTTRIYIGNEGRIDIYEKGEEKIEYMDLSSDAAEHKWDKSTKEYFSNGAYFIYHCSECDETYKVFDPTANTLGMTSDGTWYDYVNGLVSTYTGLRYYNGSWWYVEKGKVNFGATTLCQYGGSWWYVQKGKVNFGATTLCNYGGTWWYVEKGKVNFGATTLCLYNGTWWYVEKGKVNFGATTLCQYNGSWWYVEKGKVNFGATTLCQYGGSWWYVQKGKVNFGATTLCNYGGSWWYVQKGKVNFGATTLCPYGGTWWYVEKGKVNFNATTLCNYGGKWWYVQKGKVNFGATTLCKYNGTWWYVEKGAVNFNYTGYFKYYGTNYRIVKGVVRF